jgi:hypothetical protein
VIVVCQGVAVRREWSFEDLIESWSLTDGDRKLVGNKYGFTRLGFALTLKFFELEARFPGRHYDFPLAVVEFVAKQVRVPAPEFSRYLFTGRTFENHVADPYPVRVPGGHPRQRGPG